MKNSIRILSMVLLTAIYCFAIGVVTTRFAYSEYYSYPQSARQDVVSDFSLKIFSQVSQTERVVSNTNVPVPFFNNQIEEIWAVTETIEHLFESKFTEYTSFSGSIQVNTRKCDIIYPFHYFW